MRIFYHCLELWIPTWKKSFIYCSIFADYAALLTNTFYLTHKHDTVNTSTVNSLGQTATGRFTLHKKSLYYSFYTSSYPLPTRPKAVQFIDNSGNIIEEQQVRKKIYFRNIYNKYVDWFIRRTNNIAHFCRYFLLVLCIKMPLVKSAAYGDECQANIEPHWKMKNSALSWCGMNMIYAYKDHWWSKPLYLLHELAKFFSQFA